VRLVSEDAKGVTYDESRSSLRLSPASALDLTGLTGFSRLLAAHKLAAAQDPHATSPGCVLQGTVRVKSLPGHVYVAAPRVLSNVDGRMMFTITPEALAGGFNVSHTIRALSFGPPFPGQASPLEGATTLPARGAAAYQYHLRVVPTMYETLSGRVIDSRQYSASDFAQEHERNSAVFVHPGVWLRYDFSPTVVRRVEVRRSFLQFVTSLFAILGGVFSISGVLDQVWFRATEVKKDK
jgi:hypothetical protein